MLASSLLPGAAIAAGEVERRFQRGSQLAADGRFAAALVEMEAAYQLRPDGVLAYNVGFLHCKLGHREEALRYLDIYKAKVPKGPQEQLRLYQRCLDKLPAPAAPEPEPPPAPLQEPAPAVVAPVAPPPVPAAAPALTTPAAAPRPLWRIGTGVALGGVGLAMGAAGVWAAAVHGQCVAELVPPALVCDERYRTDAAAGVLISLGLALMGGGAALAAWPGTRITASWLPGGAALALSRSF